MLLRHRLFFRLVTGLLYNRFIGRHIFNLIQKKLSAYFNSGKGRAGLSSSKRIQNEKIMMISSIFETMKKSIANGAVSKSLASEVLRLWTGAVIPAKNHNPEIRCFIEENKSKPPFFLVISPGKACNLSCSDCYAGSISGDSKLSWQLLDRIVKDAINLWGVKLIVFSGGEPFMYHSEGKGILDIARKNPDCLFLAFTNGTLLDIDLAIKIAGCKNITPAISVEGLKMATDFRRGAGIFDKAVSAMENMKKAGAPFGISVTVNRKNCLDVLKDDFLDFFFNDMGAFYGFYFQYLPIGRSADFSMMPTPAQRLDFWKKIWEVIEERKLFILDFWNHGTLVDGCISAGRGGGYIHIDWDGNVTPCVFAPFSAGNIIDIYNNGGNINTVWNSGFFSAIRQWQKDYGYGKNSTPEKSNLMTPCPYRDHHLQFLDLIKKFNIEPSDYGSDIEFSEDKCCGNMACYDTELAELIDPVWKEMYVKNNLE